MKKANTIPEYISASPKEIQGRLKQIRGCIKKSIPDADEGLKWGMPAYSYDRILVMFAGFKNHIGFYPTPSAVKKFSKELSKYHFAKGSIQFPHDKPLPLGLISKISKFRAQQSKEQDVKWKSRLTK